MTREEFTEFARNMREAEPGVVDGLALWGPVEHLED